VDDVASLIASFFSESDLVFSDIVAGILLHIHSTSKKQQPQQDFEMENPTVKDWMKPPECFEVALRYLDFSSAIYAFPQYLGTYLLYISICIQLI
jgi:hypothetical protein